MLRLRNNILLVIIHLFTFAVSGQQVNSYFEQISYEQGLSQSTVNSIIRDHVGFIWFGTEDGLNLYDGKRIRVYKHIDGDGSSLSHSAVWSLFEDSEGVLWVGTFEGLNRYDRENDCFLNYFHKEGDEKSLSSNYIKSITEDSRGQLWIGTSSGLNLMNKESGEFRRYCVSGNNEGQDNPSAVVNVLEVDHRGQLWVGCQNGLNLFDSRKDEFYTYELSNGTTNSNIISLFEDNAGTLWAGTDGSGLYSLSRSNNKFHRFPLEIGEGMNSLHVKAIRGSGDRVWIATDKGLFLFNSVDSSLVIYRNDIHKKLSLSDNNLRSLFAEKNGFVWIGTVSSGVNVLNPARQKFNHVEKGMEKGTQLVDNKIKAFAQVAEEEILIGSKEGLSLYNKEEGAFLELPAELKKITRGRTIKSITVCKENKYWLAINSELVKYDPLDRSIEVIIGYDDGLIEARSNIISMYHDSKNELWIGTNGNGLIRYNKSSGNKKIYKHNEGESESLSNDRIFSILEDLTGNIWLATAGGGLSRFNRQREVFTSWSSYKTADSEFKFNYALSLYADREGDIWAGTFGYGMVRYIRENDSFEYYSESNGLPSNVIYGILDDRQGKLWLSHNEGLSRFDPLKGEYINYDASDGLQGNEFTSNAFLKCSDGTLLFGGSNGFNVFHPDSIPINNNRPRLVFTMLKVANETIRPGTNNDGRTILSRSIGSSKTINLLYSDRDIYIEFAALDFSSPERNAYKYRFQNDNGDWLELGSINSVSFHSLPYGDNVLQVIASNNDGRWNKEGAILHIVVKPPFYATLGLKLVAVGLLLFLFLLLFNIRTRAMRSRQKELETIVRSKTREVLNQLDELDAKNIELEASNLDVREQRDKTLEMSRMLAEANESKIRFFTNISHEFKTPLTLILGFVEKLQNAPADNSKLERIRDYKMIDNNAKRLLRLINKLMSFSKLTNKQTNLKISEQDLVDFTRKQAQLYMNLAEKRKISYSFESSHEKLSAWFDRESIEEVANNLLSNAFNYCPENSSITVKTGKVTDPAFEKLCEHLPVERAGKLFLSVIDNGPGISADKQKHLFERYYQGEDVSATQIGTGLGLSIAKMIADLHKGELQLKSAPGQGSIFTLIINTGMEHLQEYEIYKPGEEDLIHAIEDEPAEHKDFSPNGVIEKLSMMDMPGVLVIEDNSELREMIIGGLKNEYNVKGTDNAEHALEIVENDNPALVICDVMLTGELTGFDFTERFKSNFTSSHIPVILLTALDNVDNKILGIEKGADKYMTKPFSMRELKASVRSLIESRISLRKTFREQGFIHSDKLKISDKDESFIQAVIRIIEENMSNPEFSASSLSDGMGISQTKLYRKLKGLTDMTITDFIRELRMRKAINMIIDTEKNISEIAYEVGFNDPNYFGKCFKAHSGMSPSQFVKQHKES